MYVQKLQMEHKQNKKKQHKDIYRSRNTNAESKYSFVTENDLYRENCTFADIKRKRM